MSQDNNSTKNQYLTDYNKSDVDWDIHKASTDKISYFYHTSFDSSHHKYSQRMDSCAELLRFNFVDDLTTGESKLKLNRTSFCRVRLCPVCQWRRSMAWRGRMFNRLPSLLEENPNYEFIFLTLTVKNCEITSLASTLEDMNKAWKKLISLKLFKKNIQGFLRSTEVTKGGDGSAHPHFHTILVVKKSYFGKNYIKTAQWAEMWQQCLKVDYLPVCDVRKVKKQAQGLEIKAICELLKYTTKIKDLLDDKDWFLELSDQLYKKRFLASGGCLKDMLKEDTSNQEMILGDSSSDDLELEQDELKKKSLYFGWEQQVKKYKKVKNPYTGN